MTALSFRLSALGARLRASGLRHQNLCILISRSPTTGGKTWEVNWITERHECRRSELSKF
jgi:hypothetical protein